MNAPRRLVALLVFCLTACGEPDEQRGSATRDSAGVQIVESPLGGSAADREWRAAEAPQVEVGEAGGSASGGLYQVVSAFRTSDGRIVVASAGSGELRIYGSDGEHRQTIGRRGQGPGEFGRLFWAGRWRGDSIAAWDAELARLSVFDSNGTFARTISPGAPLGLFPQLRGVLADGSFVLAAGMDRSRAMAMVSGVRRDSVTLVVVGSEGGVRDTLGRFPGSEQYLMVPPGGGFIMHPLPFGRTTAAAAQGARVAIGTGDRYEIALYEPGHGLRRLIRDAGERRRVTDEDIRRYRETMVPSGAEGDGFARRQQQQFLQEVPYPDRMPALMEILPGGEGSWWVQDPPTRDGTSTWRLVSGDGRLLGSFRTPSGLAVKEIGPDWVLGVYLDESDVEHVRIYALER